MSPVALFGSTALSEFTPSAFAMSTTNAVMELRVDTFAVVRNFQEVIRVPRG